MEDFFGVPLSAPHETRAAGFNAFNPVDTLPASDFALFAGPGSEATYPSSTGADMFPNIGFPGDDEGLADIDDYFIMN
jgi:hypothetical protein